jgi:hypothetical protein
MVTQFLLQRFGPETTFGDELPEGVCGCPFFHENEEIAQVADKIEELPDNSRLEKLFEKLCELSYETKDSSMRCTVYDTATKTFATNPIFLPCPFIGEENRDTYPFHQRKVEPRTSKAVTSASIAGAAAAASSSSDVAEASQLPTRKKPSNARTWKEAIDAPVDLGQIQAAAEDNKKQITRLQELLEAEKRRTEEINREKTLLLQKQKDEEEIRRLAAALDAMRAENGKLRRQVSSALPPPPIVVEPARTLKIRSKPALKASAGEDQGTEEGDDVIHDGSKESGAESKGKKDDKDDDGAAPPAEKK